MGYKNIRKIMDADEIIKLLPLPEELRKIKEKRDEEIRNVFNGTSDKFIVIIGPCSADNEEAVCEYVSRLGKLQEKVKDKLIIIPRIYTNKPRTT
ncbi:MAG: 3-deoxy-7-phosphoheptulonate synthase, partial [Bacilli bacterium]